METIDNISPLTPAPSSTAREQRRPPRKPREKKPADHPRRQPADGQEDTDISPGHIDEYA
ncbi:MAG: hypothetical protein QNL87_06425 [Gammaproteobacteria bacterium]|nr:hypothetical protein [Gammaproteobacteria bacterium]